MCILRSGMIEIDNKAEEEEEEEEEEVNSDDEEYDYHSEDVDVDDIPSDMDDEYEYTNNDSDSDSETDIDTDEEDYTNTNASVVTVGDHVVVGQMSIAASRVELYMRFIEKFGEIVPSNLPNYKVAPTCVVLADLLNLVETMVDITPEEISQELVSDWGGMVSFYGGVGLKLGWLEDRVRRYGDWLVRRSGVDVDQFRGKVAAKEDELEEERKEVTELESELQELCAELDKAHLSQSQFGFSFFDE